MNGMYNMFTVINLLAAQKKLKANNVEGQTTKLILPSFLPGIAGNPVPQFLMTDAAVNNAITSKEKDDVEAQKRIVDQNNIQLTTDNAALTGANTELATAVVQIGGALITIDSTGKVTENDQSKALLAVAKASPTVKKILLASNLSQTIKDFVDKGTLVLASPGGIFADTSSSPLPDPKKQKLAPTS